MKQVFKYPLEIAESQSLFLPRGFELLCIKVQHGVPCLWAKVEADVIGKVHVPIYMVGTGHPMNDEARVYIDTIMVEDGALVFHFFTNYVWNK